MSLQNDRPDITMLREEFLRIFNKKYESGGSPLDDYIQQLEIETNRHNRMVESAMVDRRRRKMEEQG